MTQNFQDCQQLFGKIRLSARIVFVAFLSICMAMQVQGQARVDTDTSKVPKTPVRTQSSRPNQSGANPANAGSLRKEVSGGLDNQNAGDQLTNRTDTLSELEKKVFGYLIFHNSSSNFAPNLTMATPKSYVVGPRDVLLLQVFGVAQNTYTLNVSAEGNVTIPDIGMAHVGGYSIDAVKSLLQAKLATRYSGMRSSPQTTFLEVTLSNIRTIKISMVGEVSRPGTYDLPSYVNVFNALFAAGGPTVKGTFRYVQVYRAGRLAAEIDIYDFLVNGKTSNNIRLEDDDVILIRPATTRVELAGEVRTPGIFEVKNNESFNDVLRFAGGFNDNAYKQLVNVNRKGLTEKQVFDLTRDQYGKTSLTDGDLISVNAILDRFTNRVQAAGAVSRPGPFELAKGMTVADLIQKAGGLKGDAFLKRALLYRTRPDFTQEVISIDLTDSSRISGTASIFLEREDVLSVANIYDLQEEFYVLVSGEVNNVGVFPFVDSMSVADLLVRAGGFKYSASNSFIEIARRTLDDPGKVAEVINTSVNKDLGLNGDTKKVLLRPFDHVFVRVKPGYQPPRLVSIEGEVQYPGTYAISEKEMRLSDLLGRAGGLTKYAYVKGATLVRRTKKFIAPSLSEEENLNLTNLKDNLAKDRVIASTESNKSLSKRVDTKMKQNEVTIDKEKEKAQKDKANEELIQNNTTLLNASVNPAQQNKEQELVAIDFDQIILHPGTDVDLVLREGDILKIPEVLQTVRINGAVLYPVSVRFEPGIGFTEYINRAGGYAQKAARNNSYVVQANGRVQRVKHFLFFRSYPKVEPGAEVYVQYNLIERPPFSFDRAVSILTTTLTLIFLLRTL